MQHASPDALDRGKHSHRAPGNAGVHHQTPQAPRVVHVSRATRRPGTGSQPGEFAPLRAQLAMSAGSVVVTGQGVVYWHLVGTGLDAAINTLPAQDSPPATLGLAPRSAVVGERSAPMPGQLTGPVVTLWVCGVAALKRRQMKGRLLDFLLFK